MNKQTETSDIMWLPIPGYEGVYEVSQSGQVKRLAGSPKCHKDRILLPIRVKGYEYICLCKNCVIKRTGAHQLVLLAFVGPSNGLWVNHKNGIKDDNRLENLEYCTPGENIKHAYATGLMPPRAGSNNPAAKYTDAAVAYIRSLAQQGISRREIVRLTGASKTAVRDIIVRKSWTLSA